MSSRLLHTIIFFCLALSHLPAEIEHVSVKWVSAACLESCAHGLQQQFSKIPGVAEVSVDQAAGRADLRWKPNAPFAYYPIHAAMSMIGPSIKNLRVRVKGTIKHDAKTVSLVSLGDYTTFILLSPLTPSPNEYTIMYNVETHKLLPNMREQLLQAEANKQTVTIEGPLFQPERAPPLLLITETVNVTKPKETDK